MSLNPILNLFHIELNTVNDQNLTFRDFCKLKFNSSTNDRDLFNLLLQNLLKEFGDDEFQKNVRVKKVVGVKKNENVNTLVLHSTKKIIEGVIEGGKYDNLREYADINNKNLRSSLDKDKAVLDLYYVFLYFPFDSKKGYIMIHSYTEESILGPILDILKPFFSVTGSFFNLTVKNYVPKKYVEEFKENSKIRMFNFKTILPIGNTLRESQQIKTDAFEVTIGIKPSNGNIPVDIDSINDVLDLIGETEFNGRALSELDTRVFISDKDNRKAHFDITEQLETIRPTIYLNDKVSIEDETGLPNFLQLKDYCFTLLEECIEEENNINNIDEF